MLRNISNNMQPYGIDIPVLCIFFARPEVFRKCFERVKEIRPSKLLLWQDGPRENHPDDLINIKKCRDIAEDIDWDCQVFRCYHEKNIGCDPSTHLAHKWAFTLVDRCIILEDDIVPCKSFFFFCKELLERYKDDLRVERICGMNILGEYPGTGDYFFSRYGNSWGWATWKRVAETWESNYEFLDHPEALRQIEDLSKNRQLQRNWVKMCRNRRSSGKAYWEFIVGARSLLQSSLIIYPRKNMICNVGVGINSTHAPESFDTIDPTTKKLFYAKTYEFSFPLKAPRYMIADERYTELCSKFLKRSMGEVIKGTIKRFTFRKLIKKLLITTK